MINIDKLMWRGSATKGSENWIVAELFGGSEMPRPPGTVYMRTIAHVN
jgi:hypothetical protein